MISVLNGTRSGWIGEYVGRSSYGLIGSVLGNPFKVKSHTRDEHERVVGLYRKWLWDRIKGTDELSTRVQRELQRLKSLALADDLKLECWCAPLPCHADVIKSCLEWAIATGHEFASR